MGQIMVSQSAGQCGPGDEVHRPARHIRAQALSSAIRSGRLARRADRAAQFTLIRISRTIAIASALRVSRDSGHGTASTSHSHFSTNWRPALELNQAKRICSPVRHHSAIRPRRTFVAAQPDSVVSRFEEIGQAGSPLSGPVHLLYPALLERAAVIIAG